MYTEALMKARVQLGRGSTAWLYLAAGVLIWDTLVEEDERMTNAFRRGIRSRKILVSAAWLIVTSHLYGILPEQADPIHQVGVALRVAACRERGSSGQERLFHKAGSC
jgi:hypothetical protein